jgi:hypothetical protein
MITEYQRRKVKQEITFKEDGTFNSVNAARAWLRLNGYVDGSMCRDMPIGFVKGEYDLPQKWKNMSDSDIEQLDGVVLSNDFREGSVTVLIFEPHQ